jgi:hypothetical protein
MRYHSKRGSASPFRSVREEGRQGNSQSTDTSAISREEDGMASEGKADAVPRRGTAPLLKRNNTDDGSHSRVPVNLTNSGGEAEKEAFVLAISPPAKKICSQSENPSSSAKGAPKTLLDLPAPPARSVKQGHGSPSRQSRWGWKHKKGDIDVDTSDSSSQGTSVSVETKKRRRSVSGTGSKLIPKELPNTSLMQDQMTTRRKVEAGIVGWMRYRVRFC